jgi:alpha-L-rhamnosidase
MSLSVGCSGSGLSVRDLRCEQQVNPLGIDVTKPALSWKLESKQRGQRQTGYQVLVASSPGLLEPQKADLWDSGKVASPESLYVMYEGKGLQSEKQAFWKVRTFDAQGKASG